MRNFENAISIGSALFLGVFGAIEMANYIGDLIPFIALSFISLFGFSMAIFMILEEIKK